MLNKFQHRKTCMVCMMLCISILVIILLNNMPMQVIFPMLSEPSTISNLQIVIDKGEQGTPIAFKIEGQNKIKQIEEILSQVRLSLCGMYDTIEYCTYEGDWIIRISSDNAKLFIKGNGEVYSEDFKFMASGDEIERLYGMIISWSELDK